VAASGRVVVEPVQPCELVQLRAEGPLGELELEAFRNPSADGARTLVQHLGHLLRWMVEPGDGKGREETAVPRQQPRPATSGQLSGADADLLYEVVSRRYESKPILITTNKPFAEWGEVFPAATCVVTIVDRLVHRSEIVQIDGESYRLKESRQEASKRRKARKSRRPPTKPS